GYATKYKYDADDRRTLATDPNNNTTGWAYDAVSQNTQVTDGNGHATKYGYDPMGRQNSVTDADNDTWRTLYYPTGSVAKTTDAVGDVVARYDPLFDGTFYGYDGDREETSDGLATGALTRFAYTGVSDVAQETDPDKNVSLTYHDLAGRVVGTRDPLGNTTFLAYNADSEVTQQVDADNRQINSTYDPADRLTSQVWVLANLSQAD